MQEIIVRDNDSNQRIDRFLKKYLNKASVSFIYKHLRKKNITLNGKKVSPESMIQSGDVIKIFFSDDTIEMFKKDKVNLKSSKFPKIIYEDENIILMQKDKNILSHSDGVYEKNMVDMMINYLIAKGEYIPRLEHTFRPSICNRLDRNTSGILIGAKNASALREINEAIKKNGIDKFYLALCIGDVKDFYDVSTLIHNDKKNIVRLGEGGKESLTEVKNIVSNDDFSLVLVKLITGRTHQIRTVLNSRGHSIVGDRKYGDLSINKNFIKKYNYTSQFLHNYKIVFNDLGDILKYLNGREFVCDLPKRESEILGDIFDGFEF